MSKVKIYTKTGDEGFSQSPDGRKIEIRSNFRTIRDYWWGASNAGSYLWNDITKGNIFQKTARRNYETLPQNLSKPIQERRLSKQHASSKNGKMDRSNWCSSRPIRPFYSSYWAPNCSSIAFSSNNC